MSKYNDYSKYWLELDDFDSADKKGGKDVIKLNAYRNAISNFVRIVTGQSDIKVRFAGKESYTDGKTVVIGTNLSDKDFDPAVGLALHEGSHIKLTNFELLKTLEEWISKHDDEVISYTEKHRLQDRWVAPNLIKQKLHDILNIVEDRRIDNYVYKMAPGYQGYYQALYNKYFNSRIIDKGLQSSEYRTPDWDSYMFRLINITNANRDLDALPGLRDIWHLLDLRNIDRLKTTEDALEIAWSIFCVIEQHIKAPEPVEDETSKSESDGNGNGSANAEGGDEGDDEDGITYSGAGGGLGEADGEADDVTYDELSDKQKAQLDKAINAQKEFLDGDIKKSKASRSLEKMLNAMETAGVTEEEVKIDGRYTKIPVLVVREFTSKLINNIECDMWITPNKWNEKEVSKNTESIVRGIQLGTVLGKKLKVRAEERSTKFNRQYNGKLDKRMISACGYGLESIFERVESFSYRPGTIHISIDNSGSMSGSKFRQSLITASAIAKACTMIENMDCQISFRSAGSFGETRRNSAIMLIAYDSRKHGLSHLKSMMPYVTTAGSTPEGLCFDAYMKEILKDSRGKDAFFLNFSDGEPSHDNYYGAVAHAHTRSQINKMKAENINVISYFISAYSRGTECSSMRNFRAMYGKDAQQIDVENMNDVAKSINRKFLEVSVA